MLIELKTIVERTSPTLLGDFCRCSRTGCHADRRPISAGSDLICNRGLFWLVSHPCPKLMR